MRYSLIFVFIAARMMAQAPAATEEPIFRYDTRLVIEQLTVKDKSGKPIEGLTA